MAESIRFGRTVFKEGIMPFVRVCIWEGRDANTKKQVIEKVTAAVSDAISCPREAVQVVIEEVKKANWGIGGTPASEKFPDR